MKATHLKLVAPGEREIAGGWLTEIERRLAPPERDLVQRAMRFARERLEGRALASGEPALEHALGTAGILFELRLDAEALAASQLAPVAAIVPASCLAASPYVGEQMRAIKSLSQQDVAEYLDGKGMGFAKAAELNGYPGPAHVLELADKLGLTPAQRSPIEECTA